MWLLRLLAISLADDSANAVNGSEDSAVGLMALDLASIGLANPASLVGLHRFRDPVSLFQSQWLLCYQGNYLGCLGPGSGRATLGAAAAIGYLESQNVTFFDISTPPPAPIRHGLAVGGESGGDYV